MDMGCCNSEFHALCDRQTSSEILSYNNPCPSSPSSTIYIYLYIHTGVGSEGGGGARGVVGKGGICPQGF